MHLFRAGILLFTSLSLTTVSGQILNFDLTSLNLKGKVKTLKETRWVGDIYEGAFKKVNAESVTTSQFNISGYKQEEVVIGSTGDLSSRLTYKYDALNRCIAIHYMPGALGSRNYNMHTYQYDENNRLVESNDYNEGKLSGKTKYRNNVAGKAVEINAYNIEGELNLTITLRYDDKSNIIQKSQFKDGRIFESTKLDYDDKGNKVVEFHYDANNILDLKYTYRYDFDDKGNWISKVTFENGALSTLIERKIKYL
jgi:YD repeat-containing protein